MDAGESSLQIAALDSDGFIFWYSSLRAGHGGGGLLVRYSGTGQETGRQSLPPSEHPITRTRAHEPVFIGLIPPVIYMSGIAISPCIAPDPVISSTWERFGASWREFRKMFQTQRAIVVTAIITFALSTALSLIVCERTAKRYAFSPSARWTWRVLSVLLGLFAIPTLLSLHQWPARVSCPSCSRLRRVDRENCEHCGQPFPPAETRPGDLYDAESVQGSNAPAHTAQFGLVHS
jgi:hypothetical protein